MEFMKTFMQWFTLVSLLVAGFSQSWAGVSMPSFQPQVESVKTTKHDPRGCHHQNGQSESDLHDCCQKHGHLDHTQVTQSCPHATGQCGCDASCHGSAQLVPVSDYIHASVFNAVSAVFVQETPFPYITFVQIERPPKFI